MIVPRTTWWATTARLISVSRGVTPDSPQTEMQVWIVSLVTQVAQLVQIMDRLATSILVLHVPPLIPLKLRTLRHAFKLAGSVFSKAQTRPAISVRPPARVVVEQQTIALNAISMGLRPSPLKKHVWPSVQLASSVSTTRVRSAPHRALNVVALSPHVLFVMGLQTQSSLLTALVTPIVLSTTLLYNPTIRALNATATVIFAAQKIKAIASSARSRILATMEYVWLHVLVGG